MTRRWKDDGEYWTRKERIHHKGGGKAIISIKKGTIDVDEFASGKRGKTSDGGAT
ncbi:MAG: hypothetical protein K5785_00805 [Nitrosarchaeum sp.]|nr:hypothetical protein [Nitrosarchaeum sp.]